MTTNPYTLCPHCGETHHEDETHECKSEIHEYEVGDYLLVAKDGDVLAVSGNSEFDDVDNPPTESGTIVHIIHVLDDGETWSGDCYEIELTQEQYDRVCEGEKPCNVVPEQFGD